MFNVLRNRILYFTTHCEIEFSIFGTFAKFNSMTHCEIQFSTFHYAAKFNSAYTSFTLVRNLILFRFILVCSDIKFFRNQILVNPKCTHFSFVRSSLPLFLTHLNLPLFSFFFHCFVCFFFYLPESISDR